LPERWLDGLEASSLPVGVAGDDVFAEVKPTDEDTLNGYDFGEGQPESRAYITGWVYFDENNNGKRDPGEEGIARSVVAAQGSENRFPEVIFTDDYGRYEFFLDVTQSWSIGQEEQPAGWSDGLENTSVPVGVAGDDEYTDMVLAGNSSARDYNFAELLPQAPALTLRSGEWELVSIPGDAFEYSLEYIFANESLPAADYRNTWIVYVFDALANEYVVVPIDGAVNTGVGFWMVQDTGKDVTVEFPALPMPDKTIDQAGCSDIDGCFPVDLVSRDAVPTWNIAGNISDTFLRYSDLGYVQYREGYDCDRGCSAEWALENGIVGPVWTYNSIDGVYEPVSPETMLLPGKGFLSLIKPDLFFIQMQVPVRRLP